MKFDYDFSCNKKVNLYIYEQTIKQVCNMLMMTVSTPWYSAETANLFFVNLLPWLITYKIIMSLYLCKCTSDTSEGMKLIKLTSE